LPDHGWQGTDLRFFASLRMTTAISINPSTI
jgi:hypothetical protein